MGRLPFPQLRLWIALKIQSSDLLPLMMINNENYSTVIPLMSELRNNEDSLGPFGASPIIQRRETLIYRTYNCDVILKLCSILYQNCLRNKLDFDFILTTIQLKMLRL